MKFLKRFFSFFRCREFVSSYHHADVDVDTDHVWEHQWDQFLTDFYLICHENSKIQVCYNYLLHFFYIFSRSIQYVTIQSKIVLIFSSM